MSASPGRAEAWGVVPSHEQMGRTITPAPDTVRAVLAAMGAEGRPPVDPVLTVRRGRTRRVPGAVEVETEFGDRLPLVDERLPGDLPHGYHRLAWRDQRPPSRLIVGPGRCYLPDGLRGWGWALQLYALRSSASWGMGDLADLERFTTWSRAAGACFTLVNPLHAVTPGCAQQPSPYYPGSRLWRNPLYLDVTRVPGAAEEPSALERLAVAGRALNATQRIDRDRVYRLKMEALERLWKRFDPGHSAFQAFRRHHGALLEDFTTFAALSERFGAGPARWPRELRRRDDPEVVRMRSMLRERVDFHAWLQWLLEAQLQKAAAPGGLVQDVAVGVDPQGADAWAWQDVFVQDATVGAPPDAFNPGGQDWGVLAFDPWKLARADYEPFIRTIRASLARSGGLRLDHVMGLWRLYWVPEGHPPGAGAYVRYPWRTLLDIVALESHRAGAFVIGEDLGTVDPAVRPEMHRRRMLSSKILWFEPEAPASYPRDALAAITTHDLPTIAGLWSGEDLAVQRSLGLEVDERAHRALLDHVQRLTGLTGVESDEQAILALYRVLSRAPSALVAATLTDAVACRERPNHPGTTEGWPNWALPLPRTLEEIETHDLALAIADILSARMKD